MESHALIELPPPPNTADNAAWVEHCIRRIDEEMESLAAERVRFVQMRQSMRRCPAPPTDGATPVQAPASQGGIPEDIDLTALEVDLGGAQNTLERVVKIAEAAPPGKLLNTTQVARLLLRSGTSTTKLHSLRVAAQRTLEGNPDLFELVRRATYQYVGGATSTGADHNADHPDPGDFGPEE